MAVTIKNEPVLVAPSASHWLNLEAGPRREGEPFKNEEVYPILELEVPRIGKVRAEFSVTRYVASDATLGNVWTDWQIILRSVRLEDAESPDNPRLGPEAAGVGPTTRQAISEACEPIIRDWLGSSDYTLSRLNAAAFAAKRAIDAPADWKIRDARTTLRLLERHLDESDLWRFRVVLDLLEQAAQLLETSPA